MDFSLIVAAAAIALAHDHATHNVIYVERQDRCARSYKVLVPCCGTVGWFTIQD